MEKEILGLIGAMNITAEEKDDYAILRLYGEIDIKNADTLEQILKAFTSKIEGKQRNIILDFKNVNYLDSAGIACLLKAYGTSGGNVGSRNVILINLKDKIRELFRLAKVDKIFIILSSEKEAKEYKAKGK